MSSSFSDEETGLEGLRRWSTAIEFVIVGGRV